MTKNKTLSWLVLSMVLFHGCATVYGRQNDLVPVFFRTNVGGSTIQCDGETAVALPANLQLERTRNHDCIAKADGYETLTFRIWSRLSGNGFRYSTQMNYQKWSKWTLGVGNLVAWPIDFFSGAMKMIENDHYDLRLRPTGKTSAAKKALEKTANVVQKIAALPSDVVEGATTEVMNAVVQKPAEAVGVASDEQRKEVEKLIEGEAINQRYQDTPPQS